MKKFALLFALALFASPFVAAAAIGTDCSVNSNSCDPGEYCDTANYRGTYLCTGGSPPSSVAPSGTGNFVPLAPIPGLTDNQPQSNMTLFLNNLYKFLIGFAAATAVVMIIWGGLEYATQDNVSKKSDGKAKIQQAILGLILVLMPVLVFSIINPSILNLSVNWKAITPSTTANNQNGGGQQTPAPVAPKTGCTTGSTGPFLEIAACASQNDAGSYSCKNGLRPVVAACKRPDAANSGRCLDTSVSVYCGKREVYVDYYAYVHLQGLYTDPYGQVVPRDAGAQQTFVDACQKDGGIMESSITLAGRAFIEWWRFSPIQRGNGCSGAGTIPVDSNRATGAVCYSVELMCKPS